MNSNFEDRENFKNTNKKDFAQLWYVVEGMSQKTGRDRFITMTSLRHFTTPFFQKSRKLIRQKCI